MYDIITQPVEKPCGFLMMEPRPGDAARFIDPLSDFGFRRIFGNHANKQILIHFLNAVLRGEKVIKDISFRPTDFVGAVKNVKRVIFDLMCTGENGEEFIVEMQRSYQDTFTDRMVYYSCRAISEQLPKGKQPVSYDLKETYSIAMLDFTLRGSPEQGYAHSACTSYRGTNLLFSSKQRYIIVELPKFNKEAGELVEELDKWTYLLKHMRRMREIPIALRNGIFPEVFGIAEISNLTMEEYKMYRSSEQDQFDYENCLAYAKKEAAKEGRQTGLLEGRQTGLLEGRQTGLLEGRLEGRQEGRLEGLKQGKRDIVRTLIRETDFVDQRIAALTGVKEYIVKEIRSKMNAVSSRSSK